MHVSPNLQPVASTFSHIHHVSLRHTSILYLLIAHPRNIHVSFLHPAHIHSPIYPSFQHSFTICQPTFTHPCNIYPSIHRSAHPSIHPYIFHPTFTQPAMYSLLRIHPSAKQHPLIHCPSSVHRTLTPFMHPLSIVHCSSIIYPVSHPSYTCFVF